MVGYIPNNGPSSNQVQQYSYQQRPQQQPESKPNGPFEQFPQQQQQHQPNSANYHLQPHQPLQQLLQQPKPPLEHQIQTYHPQHPSTTTSNTTNMQYIRQFLYQVNPNYSATLKFVKDLDLMTKNWSATEIKSSRRLVKFEFTTENYVQVIDFNPISTTDYDNLKPTISCIYWKEMNSYVVTSVDIILLLEYLVNQTFDVEEKNRIRRNLQSLKPNTISRANINDRNFFNLIMSMENPRPRNIEKDLKVFNWSDLRKAISKVMSKYYVVLPNESTNNPQQQQRPPPSWSTSGGSGVYPPQQQQALQSPHILQSPSSSLPSSVPTPFQYTPIQQHFPEFQNQQSPGYFPRHASLPNVMLISSTNSTTFPSSKDPYMNYNKLKAFDKYQPQFPPPSPQNLMNHYDTTPHQEYQQTRHNSQPFILKPTQFNSIWHMRKNSLPQSFHSNFYITHQQHQQQHHEHHDHHRQQQYQYQPGQGNSQPSPHSSNNHHYDSKVMSPINSGDNTPPANDTQSNDQILKRPLDVTSSSLSNKISSMLNKSPISDTKSSINNSNDLQNSKLDNLSNQANFKNTITKVNLNDLITRDTLVDKLNNGIIVNDKSNNNESSGNSTRLPSIAQLLNRNHSQDGTNKEPATTINNKKEGWGNKQEEEEVEESDLPLNKKQKNSSSD